MDEVDSEIAAIKERLVRIETILESINRTVDKQPQSTGNVVIPIAAVVAVMEVVKVVLERVV